MWQYTNECLKHEFECFWNLFVNVSKHDLLHLKAEGFLFMMESILDLYLEYFAKIHNPFQSSKSVILHHLLGSVVGLQFSWDYISRRIFVAYRVVTSVIYDDYLLLSILTTGRPRKY